MPGTVLPVIANVCDTGEGANTLSVECIQDVPSGKLLLIAYTFPEFCTRNLLINHSKT
jgi:hypothetical protein